MGYFDTSFPSSIPGYQWIFQICLGFGSEICIKKQSCKFYHQNLMQNWYIPADIGYWELARAVSFLHFF